MSAELREATGREWAYQLREWATDLSADGQRGRARELIRQAEVVEAQVAGLHAQALRAAKEAAPR